MIMEKVKNRFAEATSIYLSRADFESFFRRIICRDIMYYRNTALRRSISFLCRCYCDRIAAVRIEFIVLLFKHYNSALIMFAC